MNSDARFQYQALEGDPPSIRLLKNIREESDGFISMDIEHVTLDSNPRYSALSWVWGIDGSSSKIRLGSNNFYVSNTLYYILEWICKNPQISTHWWIDSICLNQTDVVEKSSQVNLMKRIYLDAQKIIGWLGKGSEGVTDDAQLDTVTSDGEAAIRFLHTMKNQRDQLDIRGFREEFLLKYNDPLLWKTIDRFFRKPWWRRVWTLQEFVVPREYVFWCGQESISRADMNSATYCVSLFRNMENFPIKNEAFWPAWNRRRLFNWHRVAGAIFKNGQQTRPSELTLPALIAYGSDSKATMAEDRIYSLLGLADQKLVEPEYTLGVRNSYTELVRQFVRTHDSLDIICFAHVFNQSEIITKIDPVLPSWVPDWRAQRESYVLPVMASQSGVNSIGNFRPAGERVLRSGSTTYRAGGKYPPSITFSEDLRTLTCRGMIVSYVDGIGGLMIQREAWEDNRENFSIPTMLEYVQSTSITNTEDSKSGDRKFKESKDTAKNEHRDTMNQIARCLSLDRKDRYLTYPAPLYFCQAFNSLCRAAQHSTMPTSSNFKLWFELNKHLLIRGSSLDNMCSLLEMKAEEEVEDVLGIAQSDEFQGRFNDTVGSLERRLITTEGGFIGMAPYRVEKGDIVCVLFGCNIPVVLRKSGTGFMFIGECFVFGLMDGEAVTTLNGVTPIIEDFLLV